MSENQKSTVSGSKRAAIDRSSSGTSQGSPSSTRSSVTAPPKAALAPSRATKDDAVRRKKGMKEYLRSGNNSKPPGRSPPLPNSMSGDATDAGDRADRNSKRSAEDGERSPQISELQKALKDAHEEISRLKHDLEICHAKEAPHTESEPSEVGNESVSKKSMDFEMIDARPCDDVACHDDHECLPPSNGADYLHSRLQSLEAELLEQSNVWKSRWEHERSERLLERNAMAEELQSAQKEALTRRRQLLDLKQSLSSLTHRDNQVTDGEIAERMDNLYHRIREWVVSHLRRSQCDISKLSKDAKEIFGGSFPTFVFADPKRHKINIYQAIVVANTMQIFQDPHCFKFPSSGPLSHVKHFASYLERPSAEYRKWHSSTIELIIGTLGAELDEHTAVEASRLTSNTLGILSSISGTNFSTPDQKLLELIVSQAIQISRLLRVQIAEYQVTLPQSEPFDPSRMTLIDGEDGDEEYENNNTQPGVVGLALSPCIQKMSDESGLSMQPHAITKARVLCILP